MIERLQWLLNLHFCMANSDTTAHIVGLSSWFFTNWHSDSITNWRGIHLYRNPMRAITVAWVWHTFVYESCESEFYMKFHIGVYIWWCHVQSLCCWLLLWVRSTSINNNTRGNEPQSNEPKPKRTTEWSSCKQCQGDVLDNLMNEYSA